MTKDNDKIGHRMPKRELVLRHWQEWIIKNKDLLEDDLDRPKCFSCGDIRSIERAHLISVQNFYGEES